MGIFLYLVEENQCVGAVAESAAVHGREGEIEIIGGLYAVEDPWSFAVFYKVDLDHVLKVLAGAMAYYV